MKRMVKINAAEEEVTDILADKLSAAEEDFDFIIAGLEKLGRNGPAASKEAEVILESLSNSLQGFTSQIAGVLEGGASGGDEGAPEAAPEGGAE